jgi:hypothetical protein
MEPPISAPLFSLLLLLAMLLMLEVGHRLGVRSRANESEGESESLSTVEAALFAVFGLLMAFTFSGAASRFNEKKMLIVEEANAIGTAYLRVDLVSKEAQPVLRDLFRQYVDSRLETYRRLPDLKAAELEMARSAQLQAEIWSQSVAAASLPGSQPEAGMLLLPALNAMIDITATRTMALEIHPPGIVYALLFGLGLICAVLAGYRMAIGRRRSWLHILGFAVITVVIVYVTLDVEYPRSGLFRIHSSDQFLVQVRESMR